MGGIRLYVQMKDSGMWKYNVDTVSNVVKKREENGESETTNN